MPAFHIGPRSTPQVIKVLIWITVIVSILSPMITFSFHYFFGKLGPSQLLSLSFFGIKQGYLWQFLTYFFLQSSGVGISLGLLISLFFYMFLLWFAGSELVFRFGSLQFLYLYLGGGIFAGLIGMLVAWMGSSYLMLATSGPAAYAVLVGWCMLFPEFQLALFFVIRMKAKWLVLIILGLSLLSSLSYGDGVPFFTTLAGIIWGYLFSLIVWKLPTPFQRK
ncbi:MAG: rhomboid family intramembrane serine protease [Chlamydiia bacterium]|nr:rhomboid family intramembrane serine protease [Chlamydiia bacterium]